MGHQEDRRRELELRRSRGEIVHKRNVRLRVNAGMDFPECYAHAALLDTDKGRLLSTGDDSLVTCKRCLNRMHETCDNCGQWRRPDCLNECGARGFHPKH